MSKPSKNSTRSFDFSLIGEEKPLILEREEQKPLEKEEEPIPTLSEGWGISCFELFHVDLPKPKQEPKPVSKPKESKIPEEESAPFVPPRPKVISHTLKDPSHGIEGYLSIPYLQAKFQEWVDWEKVKPWISVSGYLRMAEKNLKDLVQIENLADQTEGLEYGKSGGRLVTLEKWMGSTKDYVWMAVLLGTDENKQEYILPIDLRPLLSLLETATEQRRRRREQEKKRAKA